MARTRGMSHKFHQDDGFVSGKGGQPIQATPVHLKPMSVDAPVQLDRTGQYVSPAAQNLVPPRNIPGHYSFHGPGAEPVAPRSQIIGYRAAPATWARDMDGWELGHLLDLAFRHDPGDLGAGFVVEITTDEFNKLPGNLRRHFMAVR